MNIKAAVAGIVLSVVTIGIATLFPKSKTLDVFAILLAFIVAIYLGFALLDGHRREILVEIVISVFFFVLAILGLWVAPFFLVIGYFAHGIWDVLHHQKAIQTKMVSWWPFFCLFYDWTVGGFIFFWWR